MESFVKRTLQKCAYFEVGNILPKKASSFEGYGLEMYDRVLTSNLFDGTLFLLNPFLRDFRHFSFRESLFDHSKYIPGTYAINR